MGTVYRMTVSIPADLRERIEAVREPVNWSAVAAGAFEAKLGELAARKGKKTMKDVVQRLRASARKSENLDYQAGEQSGRDWAANTAEVAQLKRLERARDQAGHDCWRDCFITDDSSTWSTADWLAF